MAEKLPIEILLEIFYRLPADTVLKFQLVCKTWRDLLSFDKTNFAAMHFRLHTLREHDISSSKVSTQGLIFLITSRKNKKNYWHRLHYGEYDDDTKYDIGHKLRLIRHPLQRRWKYSSSISPSSLVGSCNGLICVAEHKEGFFICNPITGECLYLPGFKVHNEHPDVTLIYSGFGCIPETNEYKVVRILYDKRSGRGDIEVYTLGAGSGWRNKGVITSSFRSLHGVFFKGALHWLHSTKNDIMVFNLSDEKFHVLPHLPVLGNNLSILRSLGEWLCVSGWETPLCFATWALKKTSSDNNVAATDRKDESWSWCKEFNQSLGYSYNQILQTIGCYKEWYLSIQV